MKMVTAVIVSYMVNAFLTGGYYWNHRRTQCPPSVTFCEFLNVNHGADSVGAGLVWPIYWAARGAIWVTK